MCDDVEVEAFRLSVKDREVDWSVVEESRARVVSVLAGQNVMEHVVELEKLYDVVCQWRPPKDAEPEKMAELFALSQIIMEVKSIAYVEADEEVTRLEQELKRALKRVGALHQGTKSFKELYEKERQEAMQEKAEHQLAEDTIRSLAEKVKMLQQECITLRHAAGLEGLESLGTPSAGAGIEHGLRITPKSRPVDWNLVDHCLARNEAVLISQSPVEEENQVVELEHLCDTVAMWQIPKLATHEQMSRLYALTQMIMEVKHIAFVEADQEVSRLALENSTLAKQRKSAEKTIKDLRNKLELLQEGLGSTHSETSPKQHSRKREALGQEPIGDDDSSRTPPFLTCSETDVTDDDADEDMELSLWKQSSDPTAVLGTTPQGLSRSPSASESSSPPSSAKRRSAPTTTKVLPRMVKDKSSRPREPLRSSNF